MGVLFWEGGGSEAFGRGWVVSVRWVLLIQFRFCRHLYKIIFNINTKEVEVNHLNLFVFSKRSTVAHIVFTIIKEQVCLYSKCV